MHRSAPEFAQRDYPLSRGGNQHTRIAGGLAGDADHRRRGCVQHGNDAVRSGSWGLREATAEARKTGLSAGRRARLRATMRSMSDQLREDVGEADSGLDRRQFLAACSAAGLADTLLPGALLALASQAAGAQGAAAADGSSGAAMKITPEMIDAAAALAGLAVTAEQKSLMLAGLKDKQESVAKIRALHLPNQVAPCLLYTSRCV